MYAANLNLRATRRKNPFVRVLLTGDFCGGYEHGALKRIRNLIDAQNILVVEDQELSDILWEKAEIGEFIPKDAYEPASEWIARAILESCSRQV